MLLQRLARHASALVRPRAPAAARCAPPPAGRRGVAAAAAAGLDPPDVRKLAEMAHIDLTEEEIADFQPKIAAIVSWFDELQGVDVDGVAPYDAAGDGAAADFVTRPDVVAPFDAEAALADAPEREGAFVKVPKIM